MKWIRTKIEQAVAVVRVEKALANANEEVIYAQVAKEVAGGDVRPGLWAKALSATEGDEQRARAQYIRLRAEQIKLQLSATSMLIDAASPALPAPVSPANHRPPGAFYQCRKCSGWNVESPDTVSGRAAYCRDCKTFLYGSSGDLIWSAP
jgi:hypothetical protein